MEVGRLKKLNRGDRKYVFVADPGKDVLIIKAMMYKVSAKSSHENLRRLARMKHSHPNHPYNCP